jgi:hypothetical protein
MFKNANIRFPAVQSEEKAPLKRSAKQNIAVKMRQELYLSLGLFCKSFFTRKKENEIATAARIIIETGIRQPEKKKSE